MLNDAVPVEIITGRERRRRYSAEQKLALVDETMQPGMTVSAVARLRGVFASLLFKWRQLVPKGGQVTVICARELELRVRELDRLLGRKTMEIEVKEALTATRGKSSFGSCHRHDRMVSGEGRDRNPGYDAPQLVEQFVGAIKCRGCCRRERDDELLAAIHQIIDARPTAILLPGRQVWAASAVRWCAT